MASGFCRRFCFANTAFETGTLRGGARKDKGKGKEVDMWLGKVVNSVDLGGACKKKYVGKAQHIKGTR